MPSALSYPGVYVEEIPSGVRTIAGVATSVTAFIGRATMGPTDEAFDITSYADYERVFGGLSLDSTMSFAVRDFYLNGGSRAVIVRLFHAGDVTALEEWNAGFKEIVDEAAKAAVPGATGAAVKQAIATAATAVPGAPAAKKKGADDAKTALDAKLPAGVDDKGIQATIGEARKLMKPLPAKRSITVGPLSLRARSQGKWAGALRVIVEPANPANLTAKKTAAALNVAVSALFDLTVTDTSPGGASETFLNLNSGDNPRRFDRVINEESRLIEYAGTGPVPVTAFTVAAGDPIGEAYLALQARVKEVHEDPKKADPDAMKKLVEAYENARKEQVDGLSDGGDLEAIDFSPANAQTSKQGLYALEQLYARDGIFNLLCIPPHSGVPPTDVDEGVIGIAGAYCEKRRAVLIVDAPNSWSTVTRATDGFSKDPDEIGYRGRNGAIFFPRIRQPNPLRNGQVESFAACGVVAGICARTDTQRGVWKSPAGLDTSLIGVSSLTQNLTDEENGLLNPLGINCLRTFPVFGRVVWGARTLRGADAFADEYKYLAVRRTALYIEESLYRGLKWVVFEPNDEPLWAQIRLNVGAFMNNLFRLGAFQGRSSRDAYFVRCDSSNTTQSDINLGIVHVDVGFAPLKPAEFVVLRLQQMAGQIET